jgi:cell wall-associated NlpC family hydrolase
LPGTPTDCSNFTKNVFSNVGIALERSAADQAYQFSA